VSRRLVLFDIDGTLVSAGGISARAFGEALFEAFGTTGHADRYDYSGKTDPQIVRELMRGAGFTDEEIETRRPRALEDYRERLAASIRPEHVAPKPGVGPLLDALDRLPGVTLALLTGNLEPTARLKLEPVGANRHFPFGAFGSDHEDRYQLPRVAQERAREAVGVTFEGQEIVIVGDSIHDVLCGRDLGVRAIAVATGRTSSARLAAAGPHALLPDFSDTAATVAAILGDERAGRQGHIRSF
jgi:phosphoglycolate phosphatase-like HAD superfamily hydrolase